MTFIHSRDMAPITGAQREAEGFWLRPDLLPLGPMAARGEDQRKVPLGGSFFRADEQGGAKGSGDLAFL